MLVTSWSVGLSVTALLSLFLILRAMYTGVRILRYWDSSADTSLQIRLENESWLASSVMEYGLFFQIFSLLLLVIAADSFALLLPGAMCATGSFLANSYGMKSLTVKLVSVFLYGFWIVLHRLDIKSPAYPLVRVKNMYLLLLCPLLLADISLQMLYLSNLHPDIITSCCGVVFATDRNLILGLSRQMASLAAVLPFYGVCLLLVLATWKRKPYSWVVLSIGSLLLFPAGLWIVTSFVSPYVYAMPHHRCPFCLLHGEYNFVGYPLFGTLYVASFAGMATGVTAWVARYTKDLTNVAQRQQIWLFRGVGWSLVMFVILSLYYPLRYLILGGE